MGTGGFTFGLTLRYLDMSLSIARVIGLTAALGYLTSSIV